MKTPFHCSVAIAVVLSVVEYIYSLVPPHCIGVKEKAHQEYYSNSSCCIASSNDMNWIQHGGLLPGKCAFMTQFYADQNMSECLNHCYDYGRKTRRKRSTDIECLVDPITCDPTSRFRTADGTCNNLDNPRWGMADRGQARLVPNAYRDGKSIPRSIGCDVKQLPGPRRISNKIHKAGTKMKTEKGITLFLMQWGQFLAHDIVLTPIETSNDGDVLQCCHKDAGDPRCLAMTMPDADDKFATGECMDFQRSEGRINCEGERNPNNRQTSYIDASLVYGSTLEEQHRLRAFTKGMLTLNYGKLMVDFDDKSCDLDRPLDADEYYCAAAGDERVNEWPGLAALHTLFSREHNRIARQLYRLNPQWDDERLYQEARKIVGAEIQHVTYAEFLPLFVRKKTMEKYGLDLSKRSEVDTYNKTVVATKRSRVDTYDPTVDSTVLVSFSTAILRMGHSFIHDRIGRMSEDQQNLQEDRLDNHFFDPQLYHMNGSRGLEFLLFWARNQACPKSDRLMQASVRNNLFKDEMGHSFDLAALNLQRGRDHGMPGYNDYREYCGLSRATHFGTDKGGLVDHSRKVAKMLSQVYSCPDDIDLFTGSMTERKLMNVVTGPLQECIMAEQFRRLKHGDRFFFQRDDPITGFTRKQHSEVRKMTLSAIMCANTKAKSLQRNIFHGQSRSNANNACEKFDLIDLSHWTD